MQAPTVSHLFVLLLEKPMMSIPLLIMIAMALPSMSLRLAVVASQRAH